MDASGSNDGIEAKECVLLEKQTWLDLKFVRVRTESVLKQHWRVRVLESIGRAKRESELEMKQRWRVRVQESIARAKRESELETASGEHLLKSVARVGNEIALPSVCSGEHWT
jgi:hypothetical protein